MKKILFYISILTTILLAGITIPHAFAQETSTINIIANTDDGCNWSGAEWASDLTVYDNEVCVIQGTGRTAVNVYVNADGDVTAPFGGTLIVGSDNTNTDFTISGVMQAYGIVDIGNGLDPSSAYDSSLIMSTAATGDIIIANGGIFTVLTNSVGDNRISVAGDLFAGTSSNEKGTLEIKDSTTTPNDAENIHVYGTFNNLGGQMNVGTTIYMNSGSGTIDNDATLNVSGQLRMGDTTSLDNSGTISTGIIYQGLGSGDTPSITNSGTFTGSSYLQMNYSSTFTNTSTGSLTLASNQLQIYNDSAFTNDGTVTTYYLRIGVDNSTEGGTFTNQGTGTLAVTYTSSNAVNVYRGNLINNNTGSSVSMDIDGQIVVRGISGDSAILENNGVVQHDQYLYVREFGTLDLNNGIGNSRWVQPSSRYVYLTTANAIDTPGKIDIEAGATYSAFLTYVGESSADRVGVIINNGTIDRVDITGTPTSETVYFYIYNDSTIDNYGTIDRGGGHLNMYDDSVFTNYSTGTTTDTGYNYIYENSVFHNYGDATFNSLRVGYQANAGGVFNNYYNSSVGVNMTNTGTLYIHNNGIFNNLTDAEASSNAINLGSGTGTTSKYIQAERTVNTNTKTTLTGNLQINNYGTVETYDKMSLAGIPMSAGGYFYQKAGTTASNSVTDSTGSATIYGDLLIEAGTTFSNSSSLMQIGAAGITTGYMLNDGALNSTYTGGSPFRVYGIVESGTGSSFTLDGAPGLRMYYNSSQLSSVEIAGTINSDATIDMDDGELCLGVWSAGPGSTCGDSSNSLVLGSITADAGSSSSNLDLLIATDVEVQGNITLDSGTGTRTTDLIQYSTSHLQVTNNGHIIVTDKNSTLTSNGELDIQGSGEGNHGYLRADNASTVNLNYTTADYDIGSIIMQSAWDPAGDTTITLASGATLNLNDYENYGVEQEAIYINRNSLTDQSIFDIYGDVNISSAASSPRRIYLGHTSTTYGTAEMIIRSGGTLTNTTTGDFIIDRSGRLEVVDDSNADLDVDLNGVFKTNGAINDGTGDRGAYIGGQLECDTALEIQSNGWMDVGSNGVVTVSGSTTTVSGDMELDGTLNAGDLTVTSTGHIHSGDGNPLTTGLGSSTNFLINAGDVTVNASGKIASDGVSQLFSSAGAGSYGGEGEGKSGGGYTYGKSKLDENDAPLYGEAGAPSMIALDGPGGGGVRIYATGNIDLDGEVSADGAVGSSAGAGAGGTVIIVQNPASNTATFTGTGEITAGGGNSSTTGVPVGGGGRIVIESPLFDDPDYANYGFGTDGGTISAYGGTNSVDSHYAAAGTIVYLGDANNDNTGSTVYGTLIVDQNDTAPTSGEDTEIPNTGNIEFARVEAINAADITFATDPTTDPLTCYDNDNSSTVTFTSRNCRPNPDKPDNLFINDTYEGAQTRAETSSGGEPSVGNTVSGLYDLTPAFSIIYRNVEDPSSSVDQVIIQVDNNSDFSSPLWSTVSTPITLNTAVTNGQRTEDIVYNQDGNGTALTVGPTYYVRIAFEDTTDTYQGLWTHRDIGEYYQFDIDGSMTITDNCSSTIQIVDDVPDGDGGALSDTDANRYGNGSCDLSVTSTYGYWSILFGKQSGETAFDDSTATHNIDELTGCNIITDGGGTSDEEYGYNIDPLSSTLIGNHIETDTTCSQDYDTWSQATGNYIFNIETNGSEDEIIRVDDNNTATNETFRLMIHASVDSTTTITDYALGVWTIITTNP